MESHYEVISEPYRASKLLPFRRAVEAPTIAKLLLGADMHGCSVLDLGCGEGHYSRSYRDAGARVIGIDLSPAMVEPAKSQEQTRMALTGSPAPSRTSRIDYHVCNVADVNGMASLNLGQFQHVSGIYVLNYCSTEEQLQGMASVIAGHLLPGGSFFGMNDNCTLPSEACGAYSGRTSAERYLMERVPQELPLKAGAELTWSMYRPSASGPVLSCSFPNFWLPPAVYESCFRKAGLQLSFVQPVLDSSTITQPGEVLHWQRFVAAPPIIGLHAVRLADVADALTAGNVSAGLPSRSSERS